MREQKYDFDCSVAVAWSILKYYKVKVDYNALLKASKVCPVDGMQPIKLINLLKKYGIDFELHENKNIRFIKNQIKNEIPVIVIMQARKEYNKTWKNTWIYGHYMVVIGYDENWLFIYDPSIGGMKQLSHDQFYARWHDYDNKRDYIKSVII